MSKPVPSLVLPCLVSWNTTGKFVFPLNKNEKSKRSRTPLDQIPTGPLKVKVRRAARLEEIATGAIWLLGAALISVVTCYKGLSVVT